MNSEDPDTGARTLALARLHLEHGDPRRALRALSDSPQDPEDPEPWLVRGWAEYALDQLDAASLSARRGLALDPSSTALLLLSARVAEKTGDLASAESALLGGLRLTPDDPDLLCAYAEILAAGGQIEKAEKLVERAAAQAPDDPDVLVTRSKLRWIRSHGGGAEAAREALALDPGDARAHVRLALAALERGRTGTAEAHMRHAARSQLGDVHLAEAAREARYLNHWAMKPLWPLIRFGSMKVWLVGATIVIVAGQLAPRAVSMTLALAWIAFAVYSWVVPPLVRRSVAGRFS